MSQWPEPHQQQHEQQPYGQRHAQQPYQQQQYRPTAEGQPVGPPGDVVRLRMRTRTRVSLIAGPVLILLLAVAVLVDVAADMQVGSLVLGVVLLAVGAFAAVFGWRNVGAVWVIDAAGVRRTGWPFRAFAAWNDIADVKVGPYAVSLETPHGYELNGARAARPRLVIGLVNLEGRFGVGEHVQQRWAHARSLPPR
ncbi:hypothetical protein Bcav_3395 [Beutenbergia cavernae DSM 12333]|uniref:PH domain-containing protein n=1 Tax=Beutenbergia cavernae (strain ATCC BAA-8 / DSM 12333 / CCUG 43141 / JCM 11478 / NBRC 16432 / NCIMB 13614 / HKI 0122) TaxID=471853 RepID=C5C212_BEUC1|nr:hypothetical protein [Beutenbergia cavernae]ACQ81637.1 hypothetical protein Bcav_3395 [Beutenbergia cavernae DSM 12333]